LNLPTFLDHWKNRFPDRTSLLNDGETRFYEAKGSHYLQVRCPYCKYSSHGPDEKHHCYVHYEAEWFKCHRCGKAGSLQYLLHLQSPPTAPETWNSYTSTPETRKINPLLSARQKGLETSRKKPGITLPIEAVPKTHPAWQFLLHEGFTEKKILQEAETHGIYLCTQGHQLTQNPLNTTTNRLIFDIKEGAKSYGWQARWLPKNWPKSLEDTQEEKLVQKYLISPGLKKSYLLYNWTQAQLWDTWILVEGIKKVWKTGGFALAGFGIGNNPKPPEDLPESVRSQFWSIRLLQGKRPVGLLYDRDALQKAQEHAEKLRELGVDCTPIPLPQNGPQDLDNYTTQEIRQLIKKVLGRLPRPLLNPI
jgi:hypothetical protein